MSGRRAGRERVWEFDRLAEVREDPPNHVGLPNERDELHPPRAPRARQHVVPHLHSRRHDA